MHRKHCKREHLCCGPVSLEEFTSERTLQYGMLENRKRFNAIYACWESIADDTSRITNDTDRCLKIYLFNETKRPLQQNGAFVHKWGLWTWINFTNNQSPVSFVWCINLPNSSKMISQFQLIPLSGVCIKKKNHFNILVTYFDDIIWSFRKCMDLDKDWVINVQSILQSMKIKTAN